MSRVSNPEPPGAQPQGARARPVDFRLTRARRMSPALYRETFSLDRSFPGRLLVLFVRPASDADRRLGVVTSRRALPEATMRNRARRLMRESFRLHRAFLRPGVDVLLLARGRIEHARRQDVDADLRAVCRKAGIWRETPC